MKSSKPNSEVGNVFVLGFEGTEIFYVASERRISSQLVLQTIGGQLDDETTEASSQGADSDDV
ncbi:MAG TPA: hypothetical protein VFD71_15975 [Planctomycetota bacterium]|nr:hypothetical protein [Planctomycetota bacterium]